ncbi:hypothetical protein ZWY2020_042911 [Hordeum vulgare]|nr:hypothetical protein ZWY2020_042911 [Hordeum vulgare]
MLRIQLGPDDLAAVCLVPHSPRRSCSYCHGRPDLLHLVVALRPHRRPDLAGFASPRTVPSRHRRLPPSLLAASPSFRRLCSVRRPTVRLRSFRQESAVASRGLRRGTRLLREEAVQAPLRGAGGIDSTD